MNKPFLSSLLCPAFQPPNHSMPVPFLIDMPLTTHTHTHTHTYRLIGYICSLPRYSFDKIMQNGIMRETQHVILSASEWANMSARQEKNKYIKISPVMTFSCRYGNHPTAAWLSDRIQILTLNSPLGFRSQEGCLASMYYRWIGRWPDR